MALVDPGRPETGNTAPPLAVVGAAAVEPGQGQAQEPNPVLPAGTPAAAAIAGENAQAVAKKAGAPVTEAPQPWRALTAAAGKEGAVIAVQPAENLEQAAPTAANSGLGILERRFSDILHPVKPAPAAATPAAGEKTAAAETLPAVAETVLATDNMLPEEFPLRREGQDANVPAAGAAELTAAGAVAGRSSAPSPLPPATEAAAKAPAVHTASDSQIVDQVVSRLAVDRNHETSRMNIKLQPEELGRIEIDLTVEHGRMKAQIVAQSQQVQEVLERHLPRLRESLEQHGIKLDQLQVSVDAHAGGGREFSQQQRQADSHPRPWSGARQPAPVIVSEEGPSPAATSPGKVSLRV